MHQTKSLSHIQINSRNLYIREVSLTATNYNAALRSSSLCLVRSIHVPKDKNISLQQT